jgi:hypothetical protein
MKYSLAMLLVLASCGVSSSADVVVQEPLLTITGHYRSVDGRVKEHKFPVEFKLCADGTLTGTIESWREATLTDGSTRLSYYNEQVTGKWTIKDNAIRIIVEQRLMFPQMVFEKLNGLDIKIDRNQAPNKPDAGDGK